MCYSGEVSWRGGGKGCKGGSAGIREDVRAGDEYDVGGYERWEGSAGNGGELVREGRVAASIAGDGSTERQSVGADGRGEGDGGDGWESPGSGCAGAVGCYGRYSEDGLSNSFNYCLKGEGLLSDV